MKDPYEELGVARDADAAAIKAAYRDLAKRYHPDRNPGNARAEMRFKSAAQAYALLSDEEQRRRLGHRKRSVLELFDTLNFRA